MSLVGPDGPNGRIFGESQRGDPALPAPDYMPSPECYGLGEVKGLRGDTDLFERINSDLFYLEN